MDNKRKQKQRLRKVKKIKKGGVKRRTKVQEVSRNMLQEQ